MRNLKKILALVLAMIMVVSMMVTASATTFVDDADIDAKYAEAVTVLSGIGVIRGVENADGTFNFNPKGNLNRAQAATIIAYVLTGDLDKVEDEVSVYENPFTDVAEWAVPYVLFAHSRGIIVGRNANTYDPNATITGYELGKMLLISALGYANTDFVTTVYVVEGKAYADEAEALVASLNAGGAEITTKTVAKTDWQVTVAKGLKAKGIWDNEFALSKKLTREEACYLAFNTVMAAPTLKTGVFGLVEGADVDSFGRTTKTYTSTKIETLSIVLDNYVAPTVFVATKSVTANAAGLNTLFGLKDKAALKDTGLEVYVNGELVDSATIQIGDTVEYFTTKTNLTKVIIIREDLVIAKSVASKAETTGAVKGLYKWTFSDGSITYAAKDAYTKGASYLIVANDEAVLSVSSPVFVRNAKVTKSNVATLAGLTAGKYVYVNNEKLVAGYGIEVLGGAAFGTAYDYILNSNGYLIAITEVYEAEEDEVQLETGIAYLLDAEKQITTNSTDDSLIGGTGSYSWDIEAVAKLALPDGSIVIKDLTTEVTTNPLNGKVTALKINGVAMTEVKNGETVADIDKDSEPVDILTDIRGWVVYEIQEDGSYTLAPVTADTAITLKKGTSKLADGLYATSSTVWTHFDIDAENGVVIATEKTGLNGYDKDGKDYTALVITSKTNKSVATQIYTFGTYKAPTNKVYEALFIGAGEYIEINKVGYQTFKFFVAGEYVDYFVTANTSSLVENNAYTLTLNDDGIVTKIQNYKTTSVGTVEVIDDTFVIIDGVAYYYYYFDSYDMETGEAADIEVGDTLIFTQEWYDGNEDGIVNGTEMSIYGAYIVDGEIFGTADDITEADIINNSTNNVVVEVTADDIACVANPSGSVRYWVGVKVYAPEYAKTGANFKAADPRANPADAAELFWREGTYAEDGEGYMEFWINLGATDSVWNAYNTADKAIKAYYVFDWDNDGVFEQTLTVVIDTNVAGLAE